MHTLSEWEAWQAWDRIFAAESKLAAAEAERTALWDALGAEDQTHALNCAKALIADSNQRLRDAECREQLEAEVRRLQSLLDARPLLVMPED